MNVDLSSVLTDEDVRSYHERGFLVIDALTTGDEVLALQDIYDRLFDPAAEIGDRDRLELAGDEDAPPVLPQILNPDHYAPELRETQAYRVAGEVARRLLGDDVEADGDARDPQAAARRWRDPLAPGRGLLGPGHAARGDQRLDAPAARDDRERLHAVRARKPPRRRARAPADQPGLARAGPQRPGRGRRPGALSAAAGRRDRALEPDPALRRAQHDRRAPARADHGVRAGATAARGAPELLLAATRVVAVATLTPDRPTRTDDQTRTYT